MLDVVLDNAKIKAIIINLQPHPSLTYTLEHNGAPLSSADCGFVPRMAKATDYDFVKDFNAGSLQICCKKHYEWQNFVPALPIPGVDPSAQPTLLDMVIAKALSTKGQVNPVKPLALHKLQSAKQHLFLLQRAYSKLTTKSAFYLIREIMKQFGYKVKLENSIRNLTHNRVTNRWELNTEGNIVLTEHDRTTLATKIHFTSSATLSPDVTPYFDKQLIWRNEGPKPQPQGLLFKSAEQGFSLQELKINDLSVPPLPANHVGIAIIIDAFAGWGSRAPGACTFLEQLKLSLNSQAAFNNHPSPDLMSVLTHKLRQAIPTPMTPIQASVVAKLKLALRGEKVKTAEFSDYSVLSSAGDPTTANKIIIFPEIIALNMPLMKAQFLELEPLLDSTLFQNLLMTPGISVQSMPSLVQLPGKKPTLKPKTYGFTEHLIPLLHRTYTKGCNREAEFNYNFGFKDGGYGFSGDLTSFLVDFARPLKLQGKNCREWLIELKTADAEKSDISPDDAKQVAIRVIAENVLNKNPSPSSASGSLSDSDTLKLAEVHLEILKYIYHQTVGQAITYLFGHTKTFCDLPWHLGSENPDTNHHNLFYNNREGKWYFETTMLQILNLAPPVVDEPEPIGKLQYDCTCSFAPLDLSHINLTQDVTTIMSTLGPKLDKKGFVIDKMSLTMTRSGRTDYEREKHIYLMYLVFKWSITQDETDRQNLLKYFSTFTS